MPWGWWTERRRDGWPVLFLNYPRKEVKRGEVSGSGFPLPGCLQEQIQEGWRWSLLGTLEDEVIPPDGNRGTEGFRGGDSNSGAEEGEAGSRNSSPDGQGLTALEVQGQYAARNQVLQERLVHPD